MHPIGQMSLLSRVRLSMTDSDETREGVITAHFQGTTKVLLDQTETDRARIVTIISTQPVVLITGSRRVQ